MDTECQVIGRTNLLNGIDYSYDVAGNMVDSDGTTRIFNEANQMVNNGTNMLSYDDNGNLKNDGSDTYIWDRATIEQGNFSETVKN